MAESDRRLSLQIPWSTLLKVTYGGRVRLSNVAILVAFAIGAELGGVGGALLAMPIAATYPTIEKLWLRDQLGDDVVAEHEAVRRRAS
jgi:predicted PurR-regulated permease PerM